MYPREQTIFALSSGRPPSAISIVRVSGSQAGTALISLAGRMPLPRMATRALLRNADRQRRQALRQLKGLLGDNARDWRAQICEASALIEAGIDFSDEGDVPAEWI